MPSSPNYVRNYKQEYRTDSPLRKAKRRSRLTKVDTNNSLDLNVKVEPSKIELLKRKLFFDLKRDETMSMSQYLNSALSDRDVKEAS